MKKAVSILLCTLLLTIFCSGAFAVSPDSLHIKPADFSDSVSPYMDGSAMCPSCGAQGTAVSTWPEYTYYYTYIWQSYCCYSEKCRGTTTWTVLIAALENMHDEENPESNVCSDSHQQNGILH